MTVLFEDLPYSLDALHPVISEKTMVFHHQKHYATYVKNTNELILNTPFAESPLEDIVRESYRQPDLRGLFNNAGQAYNHAFFWRSLKPYAAKEKMPEELAQRIESDFTSVQNFKDTLKNVGVKQFGSGWVWLVEKDNKLQILSTSNADSPLILQGVKPLLCIDVWEHAYYLDYQNRRAEFLQGVIDHLINWQFVLDNLKVG